MTTQTPEAATKRSFLLTGEGWPYLLVPLIPVAILLELVHADPVPIFAASALGVIRGIRLVSPRLVESEWHAAVMDRLDALRIKYAWAQEHCAASSRALDQWVATLPYGVRGEADPLGWFVV